MTGFDFFCGGLEIFSDGPTLWFSPDGEYLAFLRFDDTGVCFHLFSIKLVHWSY